MISLFEKVAKRMDHSVQGVPPLTNTRKGITIGKSMEVYGFALWIASFVCFGKHINFLYDFHKFIFPSVLPVLGVYSRVLPALCRYILLSRQVLGKCDSRLFVHVCALLFLYVSIGKSHDYAAFALFSYHSGQV
jgi:hypothetical protein